MKALKITSPATATVQDNLPVPSPGSDEILVQVGAVALNPADWKIVGLAPLGVTAGCDYAGVVVQVGDGVGVGGVANNLKKGDRVAGMLQPCNADKKDEGAFSEYTTAPADLALKVPKDWKLVQAATVPLSLTTAGQTLYQSLKLPLPWEKNDEKEIPLLVHGGSTATGVFAIQLAKLSGCKVAATASPKNFELLKSLGADAVFDYNDKDCAKKISEFFNGELALALNPVDNQAALELVSEAIGPKGGVVAFINPIKSKPRDDIEYKNTVSFTQLGRKFKFGPMVIPENKQDRVFGRMFWEKIQPFLDQGKIRPHVVDLKDGGLEKVPEGLAELKKGGGAKKMVYVVDPAVQ